MRSFLTHPPSHTAAAERKQAAGAAARRVLPCKPPSSPLRLHPPCHPPHRTPRQNANKLRVLPPGVGALTRMVRLSLHINRLEGLPPELGNLVHLEALRWGCAGRREGLVPQCVCVVAGLACWVHLEALRWGRSRAGAVVLSGVRAASRSCQPSSSRAHAPPSCWSGGPLHASACPPRPAASTPPERPPSRPPGLPPQPALQRATGAAARARAPHRVRAAEPVPGGRTVPCTRWADGALYLEGHPEGGWVPSSHGLGGCPVRKAGRWCRRHRLSIATSPRRPAEPCPAMCAPQNRLTTLPPSIGDMRALQVCAPVPAVAER